MVIVTPKGFCFFFVSHFANTRLPGFTRRRAADSHHRTLTSPPSLWPGRELRKYLPGLIMASSGGNPDPAVQVFVRSPFRDHGVPTALA